MPPVIMGFRHTMEEEQGFALTSLHVMQADTIYFGAAMFDRFSVMIDNWCWHWIILP